MAQPSQQLLSVVVVVGTVWIKKPSSQFVALHRFVREVIGLSRNMI